MTRVLLFLGTLVMPLAAYGQTCAWCDGEPPPAVSLHGVIDVHVHSAPDSGPRAIDAITVARLARDHGMRGLVFKNHYTHTASLAYIVAKAVPGIELFGGVALNASVGGVNPAAVRHMAATTGGHGKIVWMPTFDSEHYHRNLRPNPGHVSVSRDGKLLPQTLDVLDIIAELGLALATGHSSPEESLLLIEAARERGIRGIIVTHPLPTPVAMSVEQQKRAAAMGAFLEYPFNATLASDHLWKGPPEEKFEAYVRAIRAVGPRHVILSSDLGQVLNPVHTDGLTAYFQRLRAAGFSAEEIDLMARRNPERLLGLAPRE